MLGLNYASTVSLQLQAATFFRSFKNPATCLRIYSDKLRVKVLIVHVITGLPVHIFKLKPHTITIEAVRSSTPSYTENEKCVGCSF